MTISLSITVGAISSLISSCASLRSVHSRRLACSQHATDVGELHL